MKKDPVCGVELDSEAGEWWVHYHGETYYFCSPTCQEAFEHDPEAFIESAVLTNADLESAAIETAP